MYQLYIGNKNYSSWSMRPWVLLKQAGIPFEEVMVRFDSFDGGLTTKAVKSLLSRARAALRGMIVRLAQANPPVGPFVEALLAQRAAARDAHRFDDADAIRDTLVSLGVEVGDSPEGTTWRLLS